MKRSALSKQQLNLVFTIFSYQQMKIQSVFCAVLVGRVDLLPSECRKLLPSPTAVGPGDWYKASNRYFLSSGHRSRPQTLADMCICIQQHNPTNSWCCCLVKLSFCSLHHYEDSINSSLREEHLSLSA